MGVGGGWRVEVKGRLALSIKSVVSSAFFVCCQGRSGLE